MPECPTRSSRAGLSVVVVVVCLLGGLVPAASAQAPAAPVDPFARVAVLIGRWKGTSEGQPGKGVVRREYTRALDDRFIRVRNRSEYPAQAKNPKGEVHEDEGFIHVEGFVNQYVESPESTPGRLVFVSEAIENIPAGWRARETYVFTGPDAFEETFELSEPGKPFEVYSHTTLRRAR